MCADSVGNFICVGGTSVQHKSGTSLVALGAGANTRTTSLTDITEYLLQTIDIATSLITGLYQV